MMNSSHFLIMGVVNCTEDSFSSCVGESYSVKKCLDLAVQLSEQHADVIDFGAESTRPGATAVSAQQEWERLQPVLHAFMRMLPSDSALRVSVDTRHEETMLRCAELGVDFVNHVGAPASVETLRQLSSFPKLNYLASHMWGTPQDMQVNPLVGLAAVQAVDAWMDATYRKLLRAGFSPSRIWLDPGIGFGKDDSANLALMHQCRYWSERYHIVYGVSRKSFFGRLFDVPVDQRDPLSKHCEIGLAMQGCHMLRTHQVSSLDCIRSAMCEVLPRCSRY
ncbi:MAG: dihydropteroate synthase [Zetaproteobacteria bacterium]|nr:dihydropteroate synthase [Zetaproteobacteria bacterium]